MMIAGGEFGAIMQVHIQNDGPVTLQFETPNLPPQKEVKDFVFLAIPCHHIVHRGNHRTLARKAEIPRSKPRVLQLMAALI